MVVLFILVNWISEARSQMNERLTIPCKPPAHSQWHWDRKHLITTAENIVIAQALRHEALRGSPDVTPDFAVAGGISMHFSDSSGRQRTLEDKDLFHVVNWTFKVEEVLKGNLNKDQEVSITALPLSKSTDPNPTPILCHHKLAFKAGQKYLLVLKSYHPDGYRKISGKKDQYYNQVLAILNKTR